MEKERYHHQVIRGDDEVIVRVCKRPRNDKYKRPRNDKYSGNSNNQNGIENEYNYRGINNIPNQQQSRKEVNQPTINEENSLVVSNHTQLLAGYTTNNALDTEDEKKKVQFTSLKSKSCGAIYKSLQNVANRNKSIECNNQQSAPSQVVVRDEVFPGTNIKKKSLSELRNSILTKAHNNTLSHQYNKGATGYNFESSSELSYSSLDDNVFDSDDEEEELDDELLVELERVKQHYSEENEALKADVVTKENRIQELEELVARLGARGNTHYSRKLALKVVDDITEEYINDHSWDIGTKSKINNLIKAGYLDELRQLVKDEHAGLDQDHRLAKELMTDEQLSTYTYKFSNTYQETQKRRRSRRLAAKQTITDEILLELEKNVPFIEPGSKEAADIIQCIMNAARLHPNTSEATRKMLTAILVQIQEFGKKGEDFLKTWGVTPLTRKDIETFKADDDNWPYLQAGYYIGLTSTVEYLDVQKNSTATTFGAAETVSQIAQNLYGSKRYSRVAAMGAISDSLFICLCRRSASIIESSLQTFFRGMWILAPPSKPRRDEVSVVSLQKIHDSGASFESIGDGDGTTASGVFITCIPGYSATTNVRNADGKFNVFDSFIPPSPVPTFPNAKVPQGFGRGGTTMPSK